MRYTQSTPIFHFNRSDVYQMLSPSGPLFPFAVPWIFVLIGHSLQLCHIIQIEFTGFHWIVLANILTLFMMTIVNQTIIPFESAAPSTVPSMNFKRIVYFFLALYLAAQSFQAVLFGGTPLLWMIQGVDKVYVDYGIKSLNGLLNALYLFSVTGYYIIYRSERRWSGLIFFLFLLCIPVVLVSRQLIISLFFQIFCCSLFFDGGAFRRFLKLGLGVLALFVILGNFRTGLDELVTILEPNESIPDVLHSLLWVYAYMVTPFNNINWAYDVVTPLGLPFYELSSIVPSLFRENIGIEEGDTGFLLVHEDMNVSTMYLEPLLDFGGVWAFLFMVLFQIALVLAYRKAKSSGHPLHIMQYSVFYMIAALSIFSNLLLYLPVIFQLAIISVSQITSDKEYLTKHPIRV